MWRLVVAVSWCAVALAACGGTSKSGASAGGDAGSGGASMTMPSGGSSDGGAITDVVDTCHDVAQDYAGAVDRARYCDPSRSDQCTQVLAKGIECSCPTYVNPENTEALALAERLQGEHAMSGCAAGASCGECPVSTGAFCNGIGRCVSMIKQVPDAACLVEGVEYPSGSGGIPDPSSCNTCTCESGGLACTLIGCDDKPCPEGYVHSSQCAQCAGDDGCSVMEFGCLPTCVDGACDGAVCVDGVCKAFCE